MFVASLVFVASFFFPWSAHQQYGFVDMFDVSFSLLVCCPSIVFFPCSGDRLAFLQGPWVKSEMKR